MAMRPTIPEAIVRSTLTPAIVESFQVQEYLWLAASDSPVNPRKLLSLEEVHERVVRHLEGAQLKQPELFNARIKDVTFDERGEPSAQPHWQRHPVSSRRR